MKTKLFKIIVCTLVILTIAIWTKKKLPVTEEQIYATLVKLNLLREKTYVSDDLDAYLAQEGFDFEKENKKIIQDSLAKLYDNSIKLDGDFKVPPVTHHVYLSSSNNLKKLNVLYIEILKASLAKLNNAEENWQHNLWTNIPELFLSELKTIKGFKIRNIDEFKGHVLYETLVSIIKKGDKLVGNFAEASDIFRLMALQRFGGIYMDMDYEIYHPKPLLNLMRKFDFIGVKGINRYYENGFIAAKPNHPVLNKAIALEARNNHLNKDAEIPDAIKYPIDEYRRIYFSGPPLLTTAYIAENNVNGNLDILLPYWISFNYHVAQYKNGPCKDTAKVTKADFEKNDKNLEKILVQFNKNYKAEDNPAYKKEEALKDYQHNIYYDVVNYRNDFEIIGADMSCGTWTTDANGFNRIYYWQWPFKKSN